MSSRYLARARLAALPCLTLLLLANGCGAADEGVDPVEVAPGDGDGAASDARDPGAASGGAIWVEDADGQVLGTLFRRGGDDQVAGRAHYDLVTVFHPESGLFFEVTMGDGVVRYPVTTFFSGFNCSEPVGVVAGGCDTCLSGYGIGLLHLGRWWRVRGGELASQLSAGSTHASGRASECVAHSTSSARGFPVDEVSGAAPPTQLTPPLRFVWR